jgi:hypothetical protein
MSIGSPFAAPAAVITSITQLAKTSKRIVQFDNVQESLRNPSQITIGVDK